MNLPQWITLIGNLLLIPILATAAWTLATDVHAKEPWWVRVTNRAITPSTWLGANKPKRGPGASRISAGKAKDSVPAPAKVEEPLWEQLRKAHRQREAEARWQWNMDFRGDWPEGTDLVWVPPHLMNPEFCPTITQGHCLCALIQYPMSDLPPDTWIVRRDTWDGEPDSPHELFGWHHPSSAYIFHKMRPPITYSNAEFARMSHEERERRSFRRLEADAE